jgi:hypothetical protein
VLSESSQKWYKSPAFIGLVLTIIGFGSMFLLGKFVSEWLLGW